MLIEIYIFYQVIVITLFFIGFFGKSEIVWALSAVFAGVLMFSSFDVQINTFVYNTTISAYSPQVISYHYSYLAWVNMIFFTLSILLGLFDMFDKYGVKFGKNKDEDE